MTKFDWDRETREARKRAHGSIPLWADPSALSLDDEREVRRRLAPLVELVDEFASLSATSRGQRASEFKYRGTKLKHQAVENALELPNTTARASLAGWIDMLVERLKDDGTNAR